MDWLRSAHEAPAFFRIGDAAVPIRWYRTQPGAKAFPFFHAFPSLTWKDNDYGDSDLGERLPMVWRNGDAPPNAGSGNQVAVDCANEHVEWWQDGLGDGEDSGPYNVDGLPVCCIDGPYTCASAIYDSLQIGVSIDSGSCGGSSFIGAVFRTAPGICQWFGTVDTFSGGVGVNVSYDGSGMWSLTWGCSSPDISTVFHGSDRPDPFVEWPAIPANTGLCCSDTGAVLTVRVGLSP